MIVVFIFLVSNFISNLGENRVDRYLCVCKGNIPEVWQTKL